MPHGLFNGKSVHQTLQMVPIMFRDNEAQDRCTKEEIKAVAPRLMATAQAHQRASNWCLHKPGANPPNIDSIFFSAVSFELILFSVEQSLRLLLLLHFGAIRDNSNHSPHALYNDVCLKEPSGVDLKKKVIYKMNELGIAEGIDSITDDQLLKCLKEHKTAYTDLRYFLMRRKGKLIENWILSHRDVQILHCLGLALIHLNWDTMCQRGINPLWSMQKVENAEEVAKVLQRVR